MRLLRAELLKLRRPLLWCAGLGAVLFTVLLAVGGAGNAKQYARPVTVPNCAELRLPQGPSCSGVQQVARGRAAQEQADRTATVVHTADQLTALGAGAEAAGLMASLPGALVVSLLAGGHVGGEWSGRTIKSLLTHCGRRRRVLAAKGVSVWIASVAVMSADWAVLAGAGPLVARLNHLPRAQTPALHALAHSAGQFGRALLVLALFAAVGVLASVLTRSAIGTLGSCAAVYVGLLATASLQGLGRWTPATWIQDWMGFGAGQSSITALPDNFWSRFFTSSGTAPSHLVIGVESAALVGVAAVCTWGAAVRFRRSDVLG
jgi:ABC-type transport system involved in multi-copper enzyme maturation permease subunit